MKRIIALLIGLSLAISASAQTQPCVCPSNDAPKTTGWYAWIPTSNQAWLTQMTNYLTWMNTAAPLPSEYPWPTYGRYTTNNTVSWVRRTNAWGNAQWIARMPVIPNQVWQIRYTRTALPESVMSLGADIVNGYYEASLSGSLTNGLIYARRLK